MKYSWNLGENLEHVLTVKIREKILQEFKKNNPIELEINHNGKLIVTTKASKEKGGFQFDELENLQHDFDTLIRRGVLEEQERIIKMLARL